MALLWRRRLCHRLHDGYLDKLAYYKLNKLDRNKIDNPHVFVASSSLLGNLHESRDQRMTADVDRLTQTFRSMSTDLITAPLIILYYTYVTYSLLGILGPASVSRSVLNFSLSFSICRHVASPDVWCFCSSMTS